MLRYEKILAILGAFVLISLLGNTTEGCFHCDTLEQGKEGKSKDGLHFGFERACIIIGACARLVSISHHGLVLLWHCQDQHGRYVFSGVLHLKDGSWL